ncbi:hypothetical protein ACWEV3_12240 [Saccharopolyspora sp. NPDC003752]
MKLRRSVVDSLVGDLLSDPWGAIQTLLTTAWSWVHSWGFVALPALLVVAVGSWVLHRWRFRQYQDALHERARVVTIEPFVEYCRVRLADDPHLWASTLLDELRELGFTGSMRRSLNSTP